MAALIWARMARQFVVRPAAEHSPRLTIKRQLRTGARLVRAHLIALFTAADICMAQVGILPSPEKPEIDLSAYELTFNEDFHQLHVSALAPGTRWIAHTPWGEDFGNAAFADSAPGFPFTIQDGILRIETRKGGNGRWRSGLLSSTDPRGSGFLQQFGYFGMRAKLPPGPKIWPAFWLIGNQDEKSSAEIDVLEYYGHAPDIYHSTVHVWPKVSGVEKQTFNVQHAVPYGTLYEKFHTYGVSVADWTIFYLNGKEMGRIAARTPPADVHFAQSGAWIGLAYQSDDQSLSCMSISCGRTSGSECLRDVSRCCGIL